MSFNERSFNEWFEQRFPPVVPHMNIIRESYREIARDAWEAGHQDGYQDGYATAECDFRD